MAAPVAMMRTTPNRLIRCPVTNPGRNIPTTCHWITSLMFSWLKTTVFNVPMVTGVTTIRKFITT